MKSCLTLLLIFFSSITVASQSTKFTGTTFDPTGAIVVRAEVKLTSEGGRTYTSLSNVAGEFEIDIAPGIYSIEVSSEGFLTIKQKEFFVVKSSTGKMSMDFVLFGAKYHAPCGYSGANCLPSKSLIRSYEIKYSPSLREIRDEYAPAADLKGKANY